MLITFRAIILYKWHTTLVVSVRLKQETYFVFRLFCDSKKSTKYKIYVLLKRTDAASAVRHLHKIMALNRD